MRKEIRRRACLLLWGWAGMMPACGQALPAEGLEIPDAYTRSADSLALYIDSRCPTDEAKLQALYQWLTGHMTYNVYPVFEGGEEPDEQKEVERTLRSRSGVCRHFARVFQAVGDRMDIPVCFVEGYVKNSRGAIMTDPHAWCVAKVSGKWYGYDPTFGMGYVTSQKFVSRPGMEHCRVEPETSIRTHMPFDPIWQLLEHPRTFQEFDEGTDAPSMAGSCCFNDSIIRYLMQTPLQRLLAVEARMEKNGRSNPLVDYYRQINAANIGVYRQREIYNVFKAALKQYNRGSDRYNALLRYRQNFYKPKKTPAEIENMLAEAARNAQAADSIIGTAAVPETSPYAMAVGNLKSSIQDLQTKIPLLRESLSKKSKR